MQKIAKFAVLFFALAVIFAPSAVLFAQEAAHAAGATSNITDTTSNGYGLFKIGAGVGAGLVILGAGLGIGRIGGSAAEAMSRQPDIAGTLQTTMIIAAALIEGAAFFALYICMKG